MRLILHIGVWKTGSSAIQIFLNRNDKALARKGVLAPRFTRARRGHTALVKAARLQDIRTLDRLCDRMWREAEKAGAHTIVLSSEHFWQQTPQTLDLLAERLGSAPDTSIDVIAYLRPQEELWGSILAQQAKSLLVRPDGALWGDRHYVGSGVANRGMYFGKCLRRFEKRFDANVIARHYDRNGFPGGDVVRAFLELAGIGEDGLDLSAGDANLSLGWKGVAFSMALAAERRPVTGWRAALLKRRLAATVRKMARLNDDPHWIGKSPVIFDTVERHRIRSTYAEDEARLSRRFFGGSAPFPPVRDVSPTPFGPDALPPAEWAEAQRVLRRTLGLFKG